jgi:hypothetical protein
MDLLMGVVYQNMTKLLSKKKEAKHAPPLNIRQNLISSFFFLLLIRLNES